MYDCRYWLWLSQIFEPGSIRCDKLLRAFDYNPKAIYEAERKDFEAICGSNLRVLNALCDKSLVRVCQTLDFCEKNNVGLLTMDDEKYPSSLFCIDGQPPVIYYKGTIPDFDARLTLSVVGTRKVSPYGSGVAYTIAHDIASAGGIVVSGMAIGSDTAAHRGALDARGTTVAFLGSGIDVVYPKENAYLMEEIISCGAVMTDYPPHARPEGRHFPLRNRLISGVSNGVLVVEAGAKSGALITAEHALKQGKLLYAIPGRVGELNSVGSNHLIIDGAKTVTCAADIIKDFRSLFNISEKESKSGFNQFRTTTASKNDLDTPYKTPSYNPFGTKNTIAYQNTRKSYNGTQPNAFTQAHISSSESIHSRTLLFNESVPSSEYENARAYMSLSTDDAYNGVTPTHTEHNINTEYTSSAQTLPAISDTEVEILKFIRKNGRMTVDEMSSLGIPVHKLLSLLTLLEVKKYVKQLPGGYFELNKEYFKQYTV